MFRAVRRSSSGALTVFAASGLHTHVVTGRSQVLSGNGGIINSVIKLHLVGCFYRVKQYSNFVDTTLVLTKGQWNFVL
jgi:hypothetical protein